jgi:hypothetical protein
MLAYHVAIMFAIMCIMMWLNVGWVVGGVDVAVADGADYGGL